MNRKRFNGRKKVCNISSEMKNLCEEKKTMVSNLLHDFEAHRTDRGCDLEEREKRAMNAIRKAYQSAVMQIPRNCQECSLRDIVESGGAVDLHYDDCDNRFEITILIPKTLVNTNSELSHVMPNKSRQAFNDMSNAINSVSVNKKTAFSANKSMALKMPLIGSNISTAVSPMRNTRMLRSTAKKLNKNQRLDPNLSNTRVKTIEKTKREETFIEKNSLITESKTQTVITTTDSLPLFKSTSVPFLTKPPRKALENEEIIFCSTSGTPLLVDEKSVKRILSKSDVK